MDEQKRTDFPAEELPAEPAPEQPAPVTVVDIQFRTGSKVYYFDPGDLTLQPGDHVIMETARGPEFGICTAGNHSVSPKDIVAPLRRVLRLATPADEKTVSDNRAKEKRAFDICQQKIQEHKLDMQLVSAEYAFDGSKILFFFTADDRVDFRELVKNLAGVFRTRIELRQIGVRDKAKMVGGLGICGRPFCCAQFLDDFQPVSIKMAKTQNLSLNPTKISGTCGRLMCCLKYEQEAYEDLLRTSPKSESFVDTPDGRGTVVDVNLLRQRVKVRMEEQPDTIGCYQNCDICVLRNGKAKKNDPPVPVDLAPISGSGKRQKPVMASEEPPMHLDPIRFRYRPEDIVDEPAPQEEPAGRSRRRRKPEPHTELPALEETAQEILAPERARPAGGARRKGRGGRPKRAEAAEPGRQEAAPQKEAKQEGSKARQRKPRGPKPGGRAEPPASRPAGEASGAEARPATKPKSGGARRRSRGGKPRKPQGQRPPESSGPEGA